MPKPLRNSTSAVASRLLSLDRGVESKRDRCGADTRRNQAGGSASQREPLEAVGAVSAAMRRTDFKLIGSAMTQRAAWRGRLQSAEAAPAPDPIYAAKIFSMLANSSVLKSSF